jgi:hypothetical protein
MNLADREGVMLAEKPDSRWEAYYPSHRADVNTFYGFLVNDFGADEQSVSQYMINVTVPPNGAFLYGISYAGQEHIDFMSAKTNSLGTEIASSSVLTCSDKNFSCTLRDVFSTGPFLDPDGHKQISAGEAGTYSLGDCTGGAPGALCLGGVVLSKLSLFEDGKERTLLQGFSGGLIVPFIAFNYYIRDVSLSADRSLALVTVNNSLTAMSIKTGHMTTIFRDKSKRELLYLK